MEVKQVMATLSPDPNSNLAGMETTPYEEAHHRGHTSVLRVLEEAMEKRPDIPHNDMVLGVLQVMQAFLLMLWVVSDGEG